MRCYSDSFFVRCYTHLYTEMLERREIPKNKWINQKRRKIDQRKKIGKKRNLVLCPPIIKYTKKRLSHKERIARTPRKEAYTIIVTDPTTNKVLTIPNVKKARGAKRCIHGRLFTISFLVQSRTETSLSTYRYNRDD